MIRSRRAVLVEGGLQEGRPLLQPQGDGEQWIKEGKNAVKWTKLSWRRF
jgi:hypothetical protein